MTHRHISWLKSGIRIIGFYTLPWNLSAAGALLILAEFVGILEEVGQ